MNIEELSAYINLSRQTLYNLVHTNKIPYKRISKKRTEFDKDEIDDWLKTRKRKRKKTELIGLNTNIAEPRESIVDHVAGKMESVSYPNVSKKKTPASAGFSAPESYPSPRHKVEKPALASPASSPRVRAMIPKPIFVQWFFVLIIMAIGGIGGFLYSKYSAASKNPGAALASLETSSPFSGENDLASFSETGKIIVRIPSTDRAASQVNIARSADFKIQGEATSIIKPLLIQSMLSDSGSYAFKSKTIDIVGPYADDPKIQDALIHLAKNEKDPIIRMKAVTVLDKVASLESVRDALLDRLMNDENKGVRFKALEIIEKNMDSKAFLIMEKVKEKEIDDSIRNRTQAILENYRKKIA